MTLFLLCINSGVHNDILGIVDCPWVYSICHVILELICKNTRMSTFLFCLFFFFSQLFFCLDLHKPINNAINILVNRRGFSFLISFSFHKLFFILFFVNYVVFYLLLNSIITYILKPIVSSLKSFDIILINLSSHIYDV